MSDLTFNLLRGSVRRADGRIAVVKRGDVLPRLAKGEVERLRSIGAVGEPSDVSPAEPTEGREAEAGGGSRPDSETPEDFAEWMRDNHPKISEVLERVAADADKARVALRVEDEITHGNPRTTLVAHLNDIIGE